MRIWLCTKCWLANYQPNVVMESFCPKCKQRTRWRSLPIEAPTVPYVLSENDCRFLRAMKIEPEAVARWRKSAK